MYIPIKLGDRIKGREHRCNGRANFCTLENCKKFGGYVLEVFDDKIVLQDSTPTGFAIAQTIHRRWVYGVLPEIQQYLPAINVMNDLMNSEKSK